MCVNKNQVPLRSSNLQPPVSVAVIGVVALPVGRDLFLLREIRS
jgi:hypothetical protein